MWHFDFFDVFYLDCQKLTHQLLKALQHLQVLGEKE